MKRYIKSATSNARYTIKSISDEGTYFLVKDWRKNKELWVSKEKMDRHPEWWFTSPSKAKQSLKSLLSVMDEYLSDTFTVVDMSGNETPLDVKELGFDHIPEYWDDDIDASTSVKANSYTSSHKSKSVTKEVLDYAKKKYPKLYKELSDKDIWINIWSDGEYSLSYNSIKDPNTFLSDSVKDDLVGAMEELYPGSFWGDLVDIDACDKVTASTDTSSIVNKIYSVMMNYEYGYDPDMTDINSMLQELTGMGVHVDNSSAFKKAWVSAHNKAERKTWGSSGDAYHYDSLTPSELEAIENYDTEYWEYVKDHPLNIKPAEIQRPYAPDDVTGSTKYSADMCSIGASEDDDYEQLAEGDDAESEEYIEDGKYYVAGYLQSNYHGLMEDMYSDDFEEILSNAADMAGQGLYVEITNRTDGRSERYTPEDFEEAASNGEYPDHIREDLAL